MSALDDLVSIIERFRALPPVLVAVWCVDRPDALWRVRAMCRTEAPTSARMFGGDVPVYEWRSRFVDADGRLVDADLTGRPECFKTPGVYMQMNDGTYRAVAL